MTWTSYAQNYEDVVLGRVLADVARGQYIDVGAQDPRMDSVTLAFYERGWRGVNIEPVAHWHALLAEARPGDGNLCVAAGASDGRARLFEVVGSGLSTMDPQFAQRHRAAGFEVVEREVPVRRLDSICAELGMHTAHFLKIDAEGAEKDVLQGITLDALRPWVVLVESTEPNTRISRHADWEDLLLGRGYAFVYGDGINRYYLADEHAGLAPRFGPPTVLDDFVRREQVDQAAQLESRLAGVDALSELRAREIDSLVARIGDKDGQLADWQSRWHASASDAGRLLGELREALERESSVRDEAAASEARLRSDLARERQSAADLQAVLAGLEATLADARAAQQRQAAELDDARARIQQQSAELDAARIRARQQERELADAGALAQRLADDLAARACQVEQAERELAASSRRATDLEAELHGAFHALTVGHAELMRHVGLIVGLQDEQARLLASRSWRLTRPLRAVNAWLSLAAPRAAGLARALARQGAVRRAAAIALRPFPTLTSRIKARLYGPAVALPPGQPDAAPLPLSEDAERILRMAPVRAQRDASGRG